MMMKKIAVTLGFWTSAGALLCAWTLVIFEDQNSDTFYMHFVAAALLLTFESIATFSYFLAMRAADMCTIGVLIATVLCDASIISVGLSTITVLHEYTIKEIFLAYFEMSHDERATMAATLSDISSWFTVSEFSFVLSLYFWYYSASRATMLYERKQAMLAKLFEIQV